MPAIKSSPPRLSINRGSPGKRTTPQPGPVPKETASSFGGSRLHSLHLFTLSDALQDVINSSARRKRSPSAKLPELLPAAPTSSWVAEITEVNEPSLTPLQPWWKTSVPEFDASLHRKWSGEWEPLPSSQAMNPAAGILKNSVSLSGSTSRNSPDPDGIASMTKLNTASNEGDGPLALLARQNEDVGWDAATEVDSDCDDVGRDGDIPLVLDVDEVAVETVLGSKRSFDNYEDDDTSLPPMKRPRIDSTASEPPFSSQASNIETQSSTQVDPPRPIRVVFGPDPDGHPHKTKAKSMSANHRKKQAEKRRKAKVEASGSIITHAQSPARTEVRRPTKELRAKEAQHFAIRDRIYERVGDLLVLYENRVLLNCGLDLREVRMRYTIHPWNPNSRSRPVQRADGEWMALNGPEQWKLCTPAIGEYIRIAYPPEDHLAWSIVDKGAVQRWRQSEEYVYRRISESEIGVDENELMDVVMEVCNAMEPARAMNDSSSSFFELHDPFLNATKTTASNAAKASRSSNPPSSPTKTSRRSPRSSMAASSTIKKSARNARSSSVVAPPPVLLRRSSDSSLRPARNTRSRARARSTTVTPIPPTHTRQLRSKGPSA